MTLVQVAHRPYAPRDVETIWLGLGGPDAPGVAYAPWIDVREFGTINNTSADATTWDAAITAANADSSVAYHIHCPVATDLSAGTSVAFNQSHRWVWMWDRVTVDTGAAFTWGDGNNAVTYNGGGLVGGDWFAPSAASDQTIVKISGHNNLTIWDLSLNTIRQVVQAGTSSTAGAGGLTIGRIRGSTENVNGSVVFDFQHGSGLAMSDVRVNAVGTTIPTDRSTTLGANSTIGIRFGQGSWDTVQAVNVIMNRYNQGMLIDAQGAAIVNNQYWSNLILDYCSENGLKINCGSASQNTRGLYFFGGWAVAVDGHAIELAGSSGSLKHVVFNGVWGRQAGKNNWKMGSQVQEHVELIGCRGMGANRLSANTGTDRDDLYIQFDGVKVIGGIYGEDGSGYTGISGNQGRYGGTVNSNLPNVIIQGVTFTGATDASQIVAYTAAQNNVLITGNTKIGAGRMNYATTTAPAAPSSGASQTWVHPYRATLTIRDGVFTSVVHNSTTVSTGVYAQIELMPGDTWSVTYSSAPNLTLVIHT